MTTTRFDNGSVVRYDFGVRGRETYGVGRMRFYHSGFNAIATHLFVNSYVGAPVALRLVCCVGWLQRGVHRRTRVAWTGSLRQPRSSWYLRVGRAYVGGDTPQWMQRWLERRAERAAQRACEAYDAMLEEEGATDD